MMKERAKERRERNEPCTTSIEVPSSMPLFLAERGNRRTNANVKVPLRRKGRDFLSKRQVRRNLEIFAYPLRSIVEHVTYVSERKSVRLGGREIGRARLRDEALAAKAFQRPLKTASVAEGSHPRGRHATCSR